MDHALGKAGTHVEEGGEEVDTEGGDESDDQRPDGRLQEEENLGSDALVSELAQLVRDVLDGLPG